MATEAAGTDVTADTEAMATGTVKNNAAQAGTEFLRGGVPEETGADQTELFWKLQKVFCSF